MDAPRPISIRDERPGDAAAIHRVIAAAFKSRAEADLVDKLRANGRFVLSLVAVQGGAVVGHVLLTDVAVVGQGLVPRGAGLAPLAVRPTFQRRGIGAMLVRAVLQRARQVGYGFVCLVGDPTYYRRFGFRPAATLGLAAEFDAPPEAFLAIELAPGALAGVSGTVRYAPEFAEITA
jgi:putative acetyltransferase